MPWYRLFFAVGLVAVAALAAHFFPAAIPFRENAVEGILPALGTLVILAVFMERTIEVFLSAFRGGDADRLDRRIGVAKKKLEELRSEAGGGAGGESIRSHGSAPFRGS